MSKHHMFDPKFDPFNELILLNQKLDRLEKAHNAMARDYQITQNEFNVLIQSHQELQKAYIAISEIIGHKVLGEVLRNPGLK